jgi:hypothetical protein
LNRQTSARIRGFLWRYDIKDRTAQTGKSNIKHQPDLPNGKKNSFLAQLLDFLVSLVIKLTGIERKSLPSHREIDIIGR